MTTETETEPAPTPETTDWFATVPSDWSGWLAFRESVNASRGRREAFLDWMGAHLDEDADHLKLGLGDYATGRLERARRHLEAAEGDLAKLLLGRIAAREERRDDALAIWRSLADSPAVGTRARLWVIEALEQAGDVDALEKEVEAFKASSPAPADLAYAEGLAAEAAGDHAGAAASWRLALQHDEHHADATFRLAYRADLDGEDDEAIELYRRFRGGDLFPHVGALINLGVLYEDQGEDARAVECFELVANADPTNRRARRYLGDALASLEQYYDEDRERRADKQNAVLRIPVTDFELSVRARNCLLKMNIHTLGDLIEHSEQELLSFKNFGETSLQEIKDILALKGLRLGMSTTEARSTQGEDAPSDEGDVLGKPISELDLSVRSRAALATLGIKSLGELAQTNEATLLACRNFGQTSLAEIRSKLHEHGLELAK